MLFSRAIKNIYFDNKPLTVEDYKRSRRMFIGEGLTSMGIFSITSGAFLAGLAERMGADDAFNGIIGAIPALASVVQVLSSLVFEKLERRKFLISMLCFCYRFILGIIFFIPLVFSSSKLGLILLALLYGIAYVLAAFLSPPAANWLVDLTPEDIRGRYFSKRDSYSLAFVTLISLIMGFVLDIFRSSNRLDGGYAIVGATVLILTVFNFTFLSSIKEPKTRTLERPLGIKDILYKPFKNVEFRRIIILFVIWNIALQIGGPFFSVYMVTKLRLSYTYIMVMGVIASVVRAFIVVYWGRFADSRSWVSCAKYSIGALALCHALWALVDKSSMTIMVPMLHIISGIAWAGINISLFNIQFVFTPREGRTMYIGLNAAIGGLLGFLSTLVGSVLLKLMSSVKLHFLSFTITNMQLLFLASGILLLVCSLYIHTTIKEIKRC